MASSPFTNFAGRVYAITGVAGMGLSIAKLLVQYGASVSLADISQKTLDDAFAALGGDGSRVLASRVDVGDAAQVDRWIADTVSKFGRLDGAANFAGVIGKHHGIREFVDQDDAEWDLIMRVNLTGLMYCLRAELRAMKQLMENKKDGDTVVSRSIVNASSIQGTRAFPKHTAYSTSKHAVIGLTRSVAHEVAKDNIRVNCVAPGNIQTPLLDQALEIQGGGVNMAHAIKRVGTADEVAQLTLFLLSDASQYVTGSVYSIDGGWN
ncbi:hypothetical protein VTO42DRAFT_4370 [Malbranchea cinnamomea]